MADILRKFAFACVAMLLALFVLVAVANLFIPLCLVDYTKDNMWFLLYIAEPFLVFISILLEDLAERI